MENGRGGSGSGSGNGNGNGTGDAQKNGRPKDDEPPHTLMGRMQKEKVPGPDDDSI